jgi:hypothetical protein
MRFLIILAFLWPLSAPAQTGLYVPAGGAFDVGDGNIDLSRQNIYVAGDLVLGSGQISAQDMFIAEGGRVIGGDGTIRLTRNWTNRGEFNAGSSSVYFDLDPATASSRSLAQVTGATLFWDAVIAGDKTIVVTDCSIRVENKKIQPDSSTVIEPGGLPASIELCSKDIEDAKPVVPVPIPLWVLFLLAAGTLLLVRRKL